MTSSPGGGVLGFVLEILFEGFFNYVCFYIGKPIVWLTTFGRYPSNIPASGQKLMTSTVGLLALVAALLVIRNSF